MNVFTCQQCHGAGRICPDLWKDPIDCPNCRGRQLWRKCWAQFSRLSKWNLIAVIMFLFLLVADISHGNKQAALSDTAVLILLLERFRQTTL